MFSVSVIGLGFVGSAMYNSFLLKSEQINMILYGYDKYKNGGIGSFEESIKSSILFLCLPTQYDSTKSEYDKSSIIETLSILNDYKYRGLIVIKSTVEPETTDNLYEKFPLLNLVHNPEFLTARTAFEDFHNQTHIVLGRQNSCDLDKFNELVLFYKTLYPNSRISICSSIESESMKIFCNSFYAVKIQFFTELYLLCNKIGCDYVTIRDMMLKNNWINEMHTNIPGPDGQISYGGLCFPKDTNALLKYMIKNETQHLILESAIIERNNMRNDNDNCK